MQYNTGRGKGCETL